MHLPTSERRLEGCSPVPDPFDLGDDSAYLTWRKAKLAGCSSFGADYVVPIDDLARPSTAEKYAISERCRRANMAIYACGRNGHDEQFMRRALPGFAASFGLRLLEGHRSAEDDGIVVLQLAKNRRQRVYIPYTNRPMNWHTDGYYNPPNKPIRSFILHCLRQAECGGENELLDPEIAYIRLRDHNPAFIAALMHKKAMTIPQNVENNGQVRQTSTGPVFSVDSAVGALHMRYTARQRNIAWRSDATTQAAVAFLAELLSGGDPLMLNHRLEPGQGLICNNVLHNRTGFANGQADHGGRLLYRLRYRGRVAETNSRYTGL